MFTEIIDQVDLTQLPPENEPMRQYYFMAKGRRLVAEQADRIDRKMTCAVVNFGCQMNAKDAEKLSGILETMGYVLVGEETADFVIYNTCTVRDNANQKVYGRLGVLNGNKTRNPDMKIALCGCMMQEAAVVEKIRESYPFVDLIFGTHNLFRFAELFVTMWERQQIVIPGGRDSRLTRHKSDRMVVEVWDGNEKLPIIEKLPTERKYPFKTGINIMYGCDNFCSYCIVPYVRGRERSREPDDILREIHQAVAEGVIEVMLLGQNVNSYGKNLENSMTFAQLLTEVEKVKGLERIRFMTSHPKDLSDDLIRVMKDSTKICRHLHLPLQSGSTRILQAMNRKYSKEQYIRLAERIRREIPDIALTTDIMVGFPGETPEDVEDTIDVVRRVKFDNAFTFIYSIRAGTPAAQMVQVPKEEVKAGFDRLLTVVQETAKEQAGQLEGSTVSVLVEELNRQDPALVSGRLSNNTIVHFPWREANVQSPDKIVGKLVQVVLKKCCGFYYLGCLDDI
jgi:tRNA-2-methylthio-N6-dimethylallyladenosine synthase